MITLGILAGVVSAIGIAQTIHLVTTDGHRDRGRDRARRGPLA
jgi:hypothetical protein